MKRWTAIAVIFSASVLQAGPGTDLTGTWDITMTEGVSTGAARQGPAGNGANCAWQGTLVLQQSNGSLSGSLSVMRIAGDLCVPTISGDLVTGSAMVSTGPIARSGGVDKHPASFPGVHFELDDLGFRFFFDGTVPGEGMMNGTWYTGSIPDDAGKIVAGPVPPPGAGNFNAQRQVALAEIPTLAEWSLIALAAMLLATGVWRMRA